MSSTPPLLACSFCTRTSSQVTRLYAGPKGVQICDGCVSTLSEMSFGDSLPPRVRTSGSLPFARRDSLVVEIRRALEAAFPERAPEMMRDLEALMPPGGPLVCEDCREADAPLPSPCPEDWTCEHWREETYTKQRFRRADGLPAAWPWIVVLERNHDDTDVDYILLAPLLLRRPVRFRGQFPSITPPVY